MVVDVVAIEFVVSVVSVAGIVRVVNVEVVVGVIVIDEFLIVEVKAGAVDANEVPSAMK